MFRRKGSNYRKRAPKRPRKSSVSSKVKQYVKRQIHSNIETKTKMFKQVVDFAGYTSNISLAVQPIFPSTTCLSIVQGTGQGQRCGNQVTTKKLMLRYIIHPLPYDDGVNNTPVPQEVIVWIGYLRRNRQTEPDLAAYSEFFQDGNTAIAPTSTLWDALLPENKDIFHICKKIRHKVGNALSDYMGQAYNYSSNNDFKLNVTRTVDCTKYLNKVLRFNDDTAKCDSGLYMWMTAVPADGQTALETKVCRMHYTITYDFEDA